jgi:thiamine monophosphate kinase
MRTLAKQCSKTARNWLLYGGEDYELLFAAAPEFDPAGLPGSDDVCFTRIGIVTDALSNVYVREANGALTEVTDAGWDHLKKPLHSCER